MDIYVGYKVIWTHSKCGHRAGVGFVSLAMANVLPASRKLKSSCTKGSGMGQTGRMARRRRNAAAPIRATDSRLLRARRAKLHSMAENQVEPMQGRANAVPTTITVRPPSISINEGPISLPNARIMTE
jgi:hypothetical protein